MNNPDKTYTSHVMQVNTLAKLLNMEVSYVFSLMDGTINEFRKTSEEPKDVLDSMIKFTETLRTVTKLAQTNPEILDLIQRIVLKSKRKIK